MPRNNSKVRRQRRRDDLALRTDPAVKLLSEIFEKPAREAEIQQLIDLGD